MPQASLIRTLRRAAPHAIIAFVTWPDRSGANLAVKHADSPGLSRIRSAAAAESADFVNVAHLLGGIQRGVQARGLLVSQTGPSGRDLWAARSSSAARQAAAALGQRGHTARQWTAAQHADVACPSLGGGGGADGARGERGHGCDAVAVTATAVAWGRWWLRLLTAVCTHVVGGR